MKNHTLKCTDCEKEATDNVYELIGAGWSVKDGVAYCADCREK